MGTLFRHDMRLARVIYLLARLILPARASFSESPTRTSILLRAMPLAWLFDNFFLLNGFSLRADNDVSLNRFVRSLESSRLPDLFKQDALW